MPVVSLIVAAYDEEDVIAAKVANALALDYPREQLELIVASDGSARRDRRARPGGRRRPRPRPAPRRQGRRPERRRRARLAARSSPSPTPTASGRPDALRRLVEPFADPAVGYVCGQVRFTDPEGGNLEGAYWRYEMAVREMESALAGVTAGNGGDLRGPRATPTSRCRRSGSHDLSFPFALAKRGLRSLYAPGARAEEKMVPTLEGEFARKRRMMVGLWDIVVGEGMLARAATRRSTPSSSPRTACCAT